MIIVVDLDGTLCNSAHRNHLAAAKEWEQFHSLAVDDKPNEDVAELVKLLLIDGFVIGLTGRNERYRLATEQWLLKHGLLLDALLMRPNDNYESDSIIKPKLLAEHFSDGCRVWRTHEDIASEVSFILEDRDSMVEAWRNLGFNCWQVRTSGY